MRALDGACSRLRYRSVVLPRKSLRDFLATEKPVAKPCVRVNLRILVGEKT